MVDMLNETSSPHQALYRKWRPLSFDEVSGQSHITSILKNEVATGKISHAYLFCGSRGTGKTTCAKIFSRAVSCLSPVDGDPCGKCENCIAAMSESTTDIVEMDAASNTGVDYIRDIRDAVVYPPSVLKYRVYIIDEVHMLSASAFNALLKTLEEPPSNVIFILATTELSKIPVTVVSRCQRFDFKRIATADITARLMHIASHEGIDLDADAARLIARLSLGGMRDAVSMLDLCSGAARHIDLACVRSVTGAASRDCIESIARAVASGDKGGIFAAINDIYRSSLDILPFWLELIRFWRDMLVFLAGGDAIDDMELLREERDALADISSMFTVERIIYQSRLLDEAYNSMQRGITDKRLIAEMTLIKMSDETYCDTNEALLARISRLEERLALVESGSAAVSASEGEKKLTAKNVESGDIGSNEPPAEKKLTAKKVETRDIESNGADVPEKKVAAKKTGSGNIESGDRELAGWIDVLDRIKGEDPANGSFLDGSQGYYDGRRVRICVNGEFTVMMLNADTQALELIERSVRLTYPELEISGVVIEAFPQGASAPRSIEELLG